MACNHPKCEVEGCEKIVVKNHLCIAHYREKYGESPKKTCSVVGCKKLAGQEGMCRVHLKNAGAQVTSGRCTVEGCGKWAIGERMCYRHLSEKYGGPDKNPYKVKYGHKKKGDTARAAKTPAPAKAPAPDASIRKADPPVGIYTPPFDNALPDLALEEKAKEEISTLRACLAQEIYEISDGNGRKAVIVFSFVDHPDNGGIMSKEFAECRMESVVRSMMDGKYDDWMFLGAIASEIKRISEEA